MSGTWKKRRENPQGGWQNLDAIFLADEAKKKAEKVPSAEEGREKEKEEEEEEE